MKTRIITGILFTIVAAMLFLPGYNYPQISILAYFLIAAISIIEISSVFRTKLPGVSQARCVLGSIGVFIPLIPILIRGDLNWRLIREFGDLSPNRLQSERTLIVNYMLESVSYLFVFLIVFSFFIVFYSVISKGPTYFLDSITEPLVTVYVVVPVFSAIAILMIIPNGYLWFLSAMIVSWVSDVFAYFTGVTIGRHKIIPHISPKKTWEGTLGGVFGSVFIMVVWMMFFMDRPDIIEKSGIYRLSFGIVAGMILSVGSQFGDWFASSIKRWTLVKDFGKILPGHGGLTDRFDGVFFTYPIMLLCALVYYLF